MTRIRRSALFKRQLLDFTKNYRERAGQTIALQFVDQIEAAVGFIAARPLACAIYTELEGKEFRKWGLKSFPVSVFFRVEADDSIILEALYAHRMNIVSRFSGDVEGEE